MKSDVKGNLDFGGKIMTCSYGHRVDHDCLAVSRTAATPCIAIHTDKFALLLILAMATSCLWSVQVFAGTDIAFVSSLNQSISTQTASGKPSNAQSIAKQQARIAELEQQSTYDTYAPQLGEAYLELANSLSADENHDGALEAYNSALQARVSVRQVFFPVDKCWKLQARLPKLRVIVIRV